MCYDLHAIFKNKIRHRIIYAMKGNFTQSFLKKKFCKKLFEHKCTVKRICLRHYLCVEKNPRMTKYVGRFKIKVPPNYFEQKKVQDQCTIYTYCQMILCRWHYLCTEQNLQNDTVWKKLIPVQKHSNQNNWNQCTTNFLLEDIICAQKNVLHRSNIPKLIHAQKKVLPIF